jgi:hypothetical protein
VRARGVWLPRGRAAARAVVKRNLRGRVYRIGPGGPTGPGNVIDV